MAVNCKDENPLRMIEPNIALVSVDIDEDAKLRCRTCNKTVDQAGKLWKRRTVTGELKEVNLDMHDDENKNRIYVEEDHTLVIKKVARKDLGYYFCHNNEVREDTYEIEYLLDVSRKSPELLKTTESNEELEEILNLKVGKLHLQGQINHSFTPNIMWGSWNTCSKCGSVGTRKRIGECRLSRYVETKVKVTQHKILI
ncbi:uncharacterized protein LOC143236432 [Tachypleus tridentatus]|uniref:uncharacterized protein LOC143236432 n=1 Tax=Tachypleus tridentatus TaxID=6853 RepID=UPI003FD592F4